MRKITPILFALLLNFCGLHAQSFQLVKDVNPSNGGLSINCSFREVNGKLYYLFMDELVGKVGLFVSDGTASGTNKLTPNDIDIKGNIIVGGTKIYFFANDGINGIEPYVYNIETATSTLLKNIHPSTDPNNFDTFSVKFLSADGNKAFFLANDGATGNELWVTDGTALGTNLVMDIFQGVNSSAIEIAPNHLGSNMKDGKLYFFANYGTGGFTVNGKEPWVSDGTPAGTFMLKDIYPGFNGSTDTAYNKQFIDFNNKMYFYAIGQTANSYAIYETDGTTAGTTLFKSISRVDEFIIKDNLLYFTCINGPSIWSSNGTVDGTVQIAANSDLQLNNVNTCQMVNANNTLFLRGISQTIGSELFKLDATNQIVNSKDIWTGKPNGVNSNIYTDRKVLQVYNNEVFFLGSDSSSSGALQVWKSDGTASGTLALTPLAGGGWAGGNGNNYNLFATSFGVFMIYVHPVTGGELYFYSNTPLSNSTFTNSSEVKVFPNPSQGNFTIQVSDAFIGSKARIHNLLGQTVKEFIISDNIQNSHLGQGIYILQIQKGNQVSTQKIIIQ